MPYLATLAALVFPYLVIDLCDPFSYLASQKKAKALVAQFKKNK